MFSKIEPYRVEAQAGLNSADIGVVAAYFVLVIGVGLYSMFQPHRGTVSGYFLAGRHMTWLPIGASIFVSNIGSEHFLGMAGSGAAAGIAVGAFDVNALFLLQLLGWIFIPVYIASGVCTLPEYMKKRLGGRRIFLYLDFVSLALYIFTKISVDLYSGALYVQMSIGSGLYTSILLLLAVTAVLTVTGGLTAVIFTDTLQFFIMIIGGFIVMIRSFSIVGGWDEMHHKFMQAIPSKLPENSTCGRPPMNSFQMLRDPSDPEMPWLGLILGQLPASIWYLCADQIMVQRPLAAKSLSHAQGACTFAGFIKLLTTFMITMPGMISRILFPDEVGCVLEEECLKYCGNPVSCTNSAYPRLVLGVMPQGLRGVMLAVMLAALMSDLTSIFNSASALFTVDIWPLFRKDATNRELVCVGRCFTIVMVVLSIVWIPLIEKMQGGQLYVYIQAVTAYLAPQIAAIFLLGVLWTRLNEKGAFYGLMVTLILGVVRMVLGFIYLPPRCGEEEYRSASMKGFVDLHYMYFGAILFFLAGITAVIISIFTEETESFRLIRTTYWTRHDQSEREDDKEILERRKETAEAQQPTNENDTSQDSRSCWQVLLSKFWGSSTTAEDERKLEERLQHLTTLEQSPQEKSVLIVFMMIGFVACIFFYTFFSVDPYTDVHPYKIVESIPSPL